MTSTYTRTLTIDSTSTVTARFSHAAMENVDETGIDPQDDFAALLAGTHTPASLLEYHLNGADEDRAEGWRDYVRALALAAGV